MLRRFSTNFAVFSIFADAFTVAAMLWASETLHPFLSGILPIRLIRHDIELPWALYLVFPLLWVLIMMFFSVYDGQKNLRVVDELTSLTLSTLLAGVTLAGTLYLSYREISRALFLFFVLITYLALLLWRVVARYLYRMRNVLQERIQRALIVGAGPVGLEIEERLREHHQHGIRCVGFLDDDPQKQVGREDVLGPVSAARTIVQEKHVDAVVIALPTRAYARVDELVRELHDLPVRIWLVPDYFLVALHLATINVFAGVPMLDLRAPPLNEYQRLIKRLFDLLVTGLMLIPALPLMGVIALLIWLFDGRPILFKQKRVGENEQLFNLYKFRTMVPDADKMLFQVAETDENGNVIHKRRDDPRVTRIGRFLRRFSLDELPQLFNVLGGTMSLVGPRPELPELVEKYQPWQHKRFAVMQGLTGWWQINGRSDRPMHLHTDDDLYYVQNYSIWLDIQILIRTFWIVIRGKGAY